MVLELYQNSLTNTSIIMVVYLYGLVEGRAKAMELSRPATQRLLSPRRQPSGSPASMPISIGEATW